MPEISRFFGIVVFMNHRDHNLAHFHVRYQEFEASIRLSDLAVISGKLPPRALGLVVEWAVKNQNELEECWNLSRAGQSLLKIQPLE